MVLSSTKVLVTGDRNWHDMAMVFRVLSRYGPDTVLIHGAARGADRHADAYGHYRHWQVFAVPADWDIHGRAAGPIRNQRMLDEHQPDVCHAFHDNLEHSRGTKDMVARCDKAGVPVHVHRHD
jgi:hypothetical protein